MARRSIRGKVLMYVERMDTIEESLQGIITILAVAVGAIGTFLASRGVEQARWKREQKTRWDERKLLVYTEYAASVKMAIIRSRSILGSLGLSPSLTPISREDGLPLLAQDEINRSERLESLMMIGGPEIVAAARKWHEISWTFHLWAIGSVEATREEADRLYDSAQKAREAFYEAARNELGISDPVVKSAG
ncbi:MAG: hypothetical protein C0444_03145 [Microbacterium sp.]|nr:hypothetical protein [Microbacterium sp.]MBA4345632.1 hypothetical protein [Microbacterium sp.]